MNGLVFVPSWKISPNYWGHQAPHHFCFLCHFSGDVKVKATADGEETTFKLAKGTTAATDPVDLPDPIPAGGK